MTSFCNRLTNNRLKKLAKKETQILVKLDVLSHIILTSNIAFLQEKDFVSETNG